MQARILCALVIAAAAAGAAASSADAECDNVVESLQGVWIFAGDEAESRARLDAIDEVVGRMSWLKRGIARKRIVASTPIHRRYDFRVDDEELTIDEDGVAGHRSRWDGTPAEVPKKAGGPATLTRSCTGASLRSHWQEKRGAGTEVYRVESEGKTLRVTVVVSSPSLPGDITYQLSYRREPYV